MVTKAVHNVLDNQFQFGANVDGGHSVEFVLTTNQPVNVEYGDNVDNKKEIVQPGQEWRQKAGYKGGKHDMTLTATSAQAATNSKVTCSIQVDGKKVAEQANSVGTALCTASVG